MQKAFEKSETPFTDKKRKLEHQKDKSTENNFLKTLKTEKGNRVLQGGGAEDQQGNPMPHEPTNKTKAPHPSEARCQSKGHRAPSGEAQRIEPQPPAQPHEPHHSEVQPLMETLEGHDNEGDEDQQNEWKEVKKRGKNKIVNPKTPPL